MPGDDNPVAQILHLLEEERTKRRDIVPLYAEIILHWYDVEFVTINIPIMARWSPRGLRWIKREADKEIRSGKTR